jgi:hypothetical protein
VVAAAAAVVERAGVGLLSPQAASKLNVIISRITVPASFRSIIHPPR